MNAIDQQEVGSDRADSVMERLRTEQNLAKGIIGAVLCGLLGAFLAYGVNLTDIHNRTTIATAFIGVLVAFGMRQWGRGIDRHFRWCSLTIAIVLIFSSVVLASCEHRAVTTSHTFDEIFGSLNPSFAVVLFRESIDGSSVALWLMGLGASWFLSGRRLTPELLRDN
ncbi:MAG: hypothetical protein ACI97A_002355 [Planctomycetota bacterium]|jgi:hypothetical protein